MDRVAALGERIVRQRQLDNVMGDVALIMLKLGAGGSKPQVLSGTGGGWRPGGVEVVESETLTSEIEA